MGKNNKPKKLNNKKVRRKKDKDEAINRAEEVRQAFVESTLLVVSQTQNAHSNILGLDEKYKRFAVLGMEDGNKDATRIVFELVRAVALAYKNLDHLVANYHDQLIRNINEYANDSSFEVDFVKNVKDMWENFFQEPFADIDQLLEDVLSLVPRYKDSLLSYVDKNTGDNIFYILAGTNIPLTYWENIFDELDLKVAFAQGFLFAPSRTSLSLYNSLLAEALNPGFDNVYLKRERNYEDMGDIMPASYAKLKTYNKALEFVEQIEGQKGLDALVLFLNRNRMQNLVNILHNFGQVAIDSLSSIVGFATEYQVSIQQAKWGEDVEVRKPSKFEQLLLSYIEEPISFLISRSKELGRDTLEENTKETESARSQFESKLEANIVKLLEKKLPIAVEIHGENFIPASLEQITGEENRRYASSLAIWLEKMLDIFQAQEKEDSEYNHNSICIKAFVEYCSKNGFTLHSFSTGIVNNAQQLESSKLIAQLISLSKKYEVTESSKGLGTEGKFNNVATCCFDLFWNKLSEQAKIAFVKNENGEYNDYIITLASIDASSDFKDSLNKKIVALEGVDSVKLFSNIIYDAVKKFDYKNLSALLDLDPKILVNCKFSKIQDGHKVIMDLLAVCLDVITDQQDYEANRENIIATISCLRDKMPAYNKEMASLILRNKSLANTELVEILSLELAPDNQALDRENKENAEQSLVLTKPKVKTFAELLKDNSVEEVEAILSGL